MGGGPGGRCFMNGFRFFSVLDLLPVECEALESVGVRHYVGGPGVRLQQRLQQPYQLGKPQKKFFF